MNKLRRRSFWLSSALLACAALSLAEMLSVDAFALANKLSVDSFAKANKLSVDSFALANKLSVDSFAKANKNTHSAKGGPFPPLSCDALPTGPVTKNVRFVTDIYPLLINDCPIAGGCGFATCANCHAGPATAQNRFIINAGSADFTLLTLLDANRDWIVPLRPDLSRAYRHVNCSLTPSGIWRMPLVGNPMSVNQQALIYDWIKQGARGTFEGTELGDVVFIDDLESRRR